MANRPMIFEILGDASNVTEVMDGFEQHAGKVAAAAAAAFAGAKIGGAIADGLDQENAFARLEAQLGGVSTASETATSTASALFRDNFGESLDEAAAAVRSVGEQMVDLGSVSEEELQKITGGALTVADAFDKDVTEVTRAAGQMMKNGLAPDAETALDIIAKGFTEGLDASGDFLDVLMEYSEPMGALGLDGATALNMFKNGLESGAFTLDKVGDSMNEFATRAVDGSTTSAEAFEALGFNAEEMTAKIAAGGPGAKEAFSQVTQGLAGMTDAVAQDAAGVGLFGSTWEDAGKAMVLSLDPAVGAIEGVDSATESMGDTLYGTSTSKVATWRREIDGAIQDMIGLPGPVGIGAAAVSEFGGDALAMGSSLGMSIIALRGMNVGAMASSVATKAAAVGSGIATAAQWAWNAAMNANPIMLVVLAIGALVAGIVWAWQNVDGFKEGLLGAWTWIQEAWGQAGEFFSGVGAAITGGISTALDWLGANWPLVLAILTGPVGLAVLAVVSNWDSIKGAFSSGVDTVKGLLQLAGDAIYSVWSFSPLGLIITNWDAIWGWFAGTPGKISNALSGVGDAIKGVFKSPFNAIAGYWNSSVGKLSFTTPDWVPGFGGRGWSMPKIPMLASGGIATAATLAMIGEGRGPEAIVPLDRIGEFVSAVSGDRGSSGGRTTNIRIENLNAGAKASDVVDELNWLERKAALT